MGTYKDADKKKSKDLHIRLTPADMELLKRNCAASGYKSITRYVTRTLIHDRPRVRRECRVPDGGMLQWIGKDMKVLIQQVRGIAANYNQTVSVLNTLVKHVQDRRVQMQIVRRAARLDSLTNNAISALHSIRNLVNGISRSESIESDD